MEQRDTRLVNWFRQSAPYVNAHRHKTFVIMIGGECSAHQNFSNIVNDIALLNTLGIKIVLACLLVFILKVKFFSKKAATRRVVQLKQQLVLLIMLHINQEMT